MKKLMAIALAVALLLAIGAPVVAASNRADQELLTDDRAIEIKAWQTSAPVEDIDFDADPFWQDTENYTVNAPAGDRVPNFQVSFVSPSGQVIHDTIGFYYGPPQEKKYSLVYDKKLGLYTSNGVILNYEWPAGTPKRAVVQSVVKFDESSDYIWWVQRADYFKLNEDGDWEWFVTNYYITWLLGEDQPDAGIVYSLERANPGGQPKGK